MSKLRLSVSIYLLLVLLLACWPQTAARAADSSGRFQVFGAGAVSCTNFLQTQQDPDVHTAFDIWIAGYVTALNRTTPDTWSLLNNASRTNVFAWLSDFCRQHEATQFGDAVHEMLESLYPGRIVRAPAEGTGIDQPR
jgi:hypothetical protein